VAKVNLKQKVLLEGQKALAKAFSATALKKASFAIAREMQLIWYERCAQGLDVRNKRLPKYSKGYAKFKAGYVRGRNRIKGAKGRKTNRQARKMPNHIRLTGQLQSGTKFLPLIPTQKLDPNQGRLVLGGIQVDVPRARNQKVFKGLATRSQRQVDPTLSRNRTQQNKEKKRLEAVWKKSLGLDKARAKIG
jgi:hypothetical protein